MVQNNFKNQELNASSQQYYLIFSFKQQIGSTFLSSSHNPARTFKQYFENAVNFMHLLSYNSIDPLQQSQFVIEMLLSSSRRSTLLASLAIQVKNKVALSLSLIHI
eukprot:TRINITY_DN4793_c0_g1_i4.p3 TRINITY_DN4793_c0_g1~~TRINITY_DN4793_c0_g1_i4.p3  ORF type:complete len:106 (-),score=9.66 TRINITY_DN4793_c0_g1_i4:54-371(-)